MSPLNAASCTKPISKDKNVMVQTRKHYLKKTLFDLEVKGQGPRKVIMVHDTPPYGHAPIPNIIDLSQKKHLFDLKVKVQQRSLWYATHCLMVMHPHAKYH